jgi:hypothetical protein
MCNVRIVARKSGEVVGTKGFYVLHDAQKYADEWRAKGHGYHIALWYEPLNIKRPNTEPNK